MGKKGRAAEGRELLIFPGLAFAGLFFLFGNVFEFGLFDMVHGVSSFLGIGIGACRAI